MSRIFTVDSNFLRDPQLSELIDEKYQHQFIVPDLVMFEAAKSRDRERTVRQSLQIISAIPDRVFIGSPISELLRDELHHKQSFARFAINRRDTPLLRNILRAVRDGVTNELLKEVIEDPTGHIPSLMADHLDHEENRRRAIDFQDEGFERHLLPDFLRRLRRNDVSHGEQLAVTQYGAVKMCFNVLRTEYHFSPEQALQMINDRSIVMRYFYVKYWVALQGSISNSLRNRSAVQISNDNIDALNVIIGTVHGNFLSHDVRAQSAFLAASKLANIPIRYGLIFQDNQPTIQVVGI